MPTPRPTSAAASVTGLPTSRTISPVTSSAAPARASAASASAEERSSAGARPATGGRSALLDRARHRHRVRLLDLDHQVVGPLGIALHRHLARLHHLTRLPAPSLSTRPGSYPGP